MQLRHTRNSYHNHVDEINISCCTKKEVVYELKSYITAAHYSLHVVIQIRAEFVSAEDSLCVWSNDFVSQFLEIKRLSQMTTLLLLKWFSGRETL